MSDSAKPPILLVDDEPEILFSLQGLLRREFQLYTASSGQEAIEILQEHRIHVVMTDQRMPEMTGVQLMRHVKDEYPEAIRIVFTGYADIRAVVEAINHGGLYRYITKPWDPDELVEVLRDAAARYDQIAESRRLLRDLRDHVRRGSQLSAWIREQGIDLSAAPIDGDAQAEAAERLMERLNRALPSQAT
jgi:DNA-binding NtrC family response regulator